MWRGWSWISISSSLLEGYEEPEILRSSSRQFCLTSAEAGQLNWRYEVNLLGHAPGVYFLSEAVGRWELSDGDRKLGHVEQAGLGFLFVPLQVIR